MATKVSMNTFEINLDNLKPISKADRWGYYNGSMPLYLAYIRFYGRGEMYIPVVIHYDRQYDKWRSGTALFHDYEIAGYVEIPALT